MTASNDLRRAGDSALAAVRSPALPAAVRRAVSQVVNVLYAGAADRLQEELAKPGRDVTALGAEIARLRAGIPTVPTPGPGVSLAEFWSDQRAEALKVLPTTKRAKEVCGQMKADLEGELSRLTKLAQAGDHTATESQAWVVTNILRGYQYAANAMPREKANAKALLLAALDGVGVTVDRLLPRTARPRHLL